MACDDRAPGSGVSQERVGEETRRETIRGVGFSSAILPMVTGVDGGVSRRVSPALELATATPAAGILVV